MEQNSQRFFSTNLPFITRHFTSDFYTVLQKNNEAFYGDDFSNEAGFKVEILSLIINFLLFSICKDVNLHKLG